MMWRAPLLARMSAQAGRVAVDIAAGVALDRDELDAAVAVGVDVGDGGDRAGAAGLGDQGIIARARMENADLDTPFHQRVPPPK